MRGSSLLVVAWFLLLSHVLPASEMRRADSVLLNGQWEYALGDGSEAAHTEGRRERLKWRPATLPGRFAEWDEHGAADIRFMPGGAGGFTMYMVDGISKVYKINLTKNKK